MWLRTSVHCHLAWGEQPSPMMQAWLTSPDWLVWQGTPSAETTGLTDIGSVILRLEVLPFRTSFFFNGLWLFICQAVYDRPDDWQQWWSWGCIKLQKLLTNHLNNCPTLFFFPRFCVLVEILLLLCYLR